MSKRFTTKNAEVIVKHLHDTGLDPSANMVAPSTGWMNGCGDPDCCCQHPGHLDGQPMVSIKTILSGCHLHRIHVDLQRSLSMDKIAEGLGAERTGKVEVGAGYFGALASAVNRGNK